MPAKRILIVEDEADLRLLMAHSLRTVGYDVDVAATADEASRRLDVQFYGIVVADWRLPDGDGIELADRAARLGAKTLIVSGYYSCCLPQQRPGTKS